MNPKLFIGNGIRSEARDRDRTVKSKSSIPFFTGLQKSPYLLMKIDAQKDTAQRPFRHCAVSFTELLSYLVFFKALAT